MLDLQVVTLIIASILLTILIYTKAGYIGQTLSPILGGIMGWIKYIIPVGTFAIAIFLACDEDKDNKITRAYGVLLNGTNSAKEYSAKARIRNNSNTLYMVDYVK